MLKKYELLIILFFAMFVLIGCKEVKWAKKVDPDLRLKLKNLEKTSELDKNLTILFRVNEPLSELHHSVLQRKKIKIIANIGPIYTATLPAKNVIDLAKMKFVDYIQGSKKLKAHPNDSTKTQLQIRELDQ